MVFCFKGKKSNTIKILNKNNERVFTRRHQKEAQFGPVNEEIYHLDFQKFNDGDDIVVAIPVKVEGHAAGVKAGGKLVKKVNTLTVKGNYKNIPDRLIVDVTELELGKSLCVGDLKFENLELLNAKSVIVASVKATRASRNK